MPEDVPTAYSPAELRCRDDGKWVTIKNGNEWSATGLYIFIRLNARFYACKANLRTSSVGHLELSGGRPVEYAGEIRFGGRKNRGVLRFWNNASGHYRPDAAAAQAAQLDMDLFQQGWQ